MKNIIIALFFLVVVSGACAQTQDSYEYTSEFTWGINKNSAGGLIGGFVFKKAHKLNERLLETYALEIMNVKHPQEQKYNSQSGNSFIYGKSNYLYAFRLQYGRDLIFFTKAPHQGVEIKVVMAAGPSIGVVAPYYVEYINDGSFFNTKRAQYNPNNPKHNFDGILGTGGIFEGIGDSKIQLGGNIKAAANFELGFSKSQVTGFEIGVLVDAYLKEVVLMPAAENKKVFTTVFFTIFYGRRK